MRIYLAIIFGYGLVVGAVAHAAPFRLCYFSLNNQTEFQAARDFVAKLPELKNRVLVEETLPYGEYPAAGFQNLLTSRPRCDGLVLSGHHRAQGFEGVRVPGYLPLTQLEKWSCEADHSAWFRDVKAVWLQGCATSSSADQALAERYARIFPNATIFSWSGSAPSRVAPKTFPFHIKNLARLTNPETPNSAQALLSLLRGNAGEPGRDAWLRLRKSDGKEFHGIFNQSAQAYAPFSARTDGRDAANAALSARCALKRDSKVTERLQGARALLTSPALFLENAETLRTELRLAESHPAYATELRTELRERLPAFVGHAIMHGTGDDKYVSERFSAYRLYLELGYARVARWEKRLRSILHLALARSRRGLDHVERKHLYEKMLTAALADLPRGGQILAPSDFTIVRSNDALQAVLRTLIASRPANSAAILTAITRNPNADAESLHLVAVQARVLGPGLRQAIVEGIRTRANVSGKTLDLLRNI